MPVWVNDNGTKRQIHTVWVNDNGTKRRIHSIHVNDNGTKRTIELLTFGGPAASTTYTDEELAGGTATVTMRLFNDGTFDIVGINDGTLASGDWINPGDFAGDFEVRTVETSGTFSTDASNGAWIDVSLTRTWNITSTGPAADTSVTFTFEIRRASDSEVVLSRTSITFTAHWESGA
jgi:hypothetical protein